MEAIKVEYPITVLRLTAYGMDFLLERSVQFEEGGFVVTSDAPFVFRCRLPGKTVYGNDTWVIEQIAEWAAQPRA